MKKRNLIIALIISVCGVALMNMRISGNSFTNRFGATGYLLNATTRFKTYKFDKKNVIKRKRKNKKNVAEKSKLDQSDWSGKYDNI